MEVDGWVRMVYGSGMSNPIFTEKSLGVVERVARDPNPHFYPSSRAMKRAIDSFSPEPDAPARYLNVGVSADPVYVGSNVTNIDLSVRSDHVDAFVRHLASDPEVHLIKVNRTIVYRRPEVIVTGFDEDALTRVLA